jgi:dTDP-4-amino-4,6-dideoxygalactose transaminase
MVGYTLHKAPYYLWDTYHKAVYYLLDCAPRLDKLHRTGLSLSSSSAFSDEQFERVADAILEYVKAAA